MQEPATSQPEYQTTPTPTKRSSIAGPIIALLSGITILLLISNLYFGMQTIELTAKVSKETIDDQLGQLQQSSLNNDTSTDLATITTESESSKEWTRHDTGSYSYEYPTGWHIAELWPDDYSKGISIWIDDKPINTSPRDSDLYTFSINVLNGIQNPEQALAEKIEEFSNSFVEVTSESIPSNHGPIYHYIGAMPGPYLEGSKVERYYFMINQSENDKINQKVVTVYVDTDPSPELSEMIKHIVLSFEETGTYAK